MLADLLVRNEILAGLPAERLRALEPHCSEVVVSTGDMVFTHGDDADAVYVVLEGMLSVYRDRVGRPLQLLARLGPGELLGELSLFDETHRTASARATSGCRLLRIAREPLLELLRVEPTLALRIQNAAARRHSQNSAASLELGSHADVRIRLSAPVELRFPDARSAFAVLANLSMGGLSLEGAPSEWAAGEAVRFDLVSDGESLLVDGRVTWRQGDTVGIAFLDHPPDHERQVYRLLRRLTHGE